MESKTNQKGKIVSVVVKIKDEDLRLVARKARAITACTTRPKDDPMRDSPGFGVEDWKKVEPHGPGNSLDTCPECPPSPDNLHMPPGCDWRECKTGDVDWVYCATHGYFWDFDCSGWRSASHRYDGPESLLRRLGVTAPNLLALNGRYPDASDERDYRRYRRHVFACYRENMLVFLQQRREEGEPGCEWCSDEGCDHCAELTNPCPNENCEWCAEKPS
jgi:hypothetical protein